MQVESFLEQSAAHTPSKTALICGNRRITYREVEDQANRLAHSMVNEGIERGDRVAVYLDNSVEAVVAVFAILKAGAVFLVVNSTTKSDKLLYILNNCRAKGLVMPAAKFSELQSSLSEATHLERVWLAGEESVDGLQSAKRFLALGAVLDDSRLSAAPPRKKCINIDLAALIYTSGSTGRPKGVMLTHLNMTSAAASITTYLRNTSDDIIINLLPLAFDYGLYQVLMAFKMGATIVLEKSFAYPHAVLQTIIREKVTGLPIVPTISAILLQIDLSAYQFPSLRYITNTAAALPTDHIQKLRKLFPHVTLYSMYGLTECKRVSYLPPDQLDIRPTSVGLGMPNEEVYVVDENGQRVPPNVVGELVVRGANVMKGYWELHAETAEKLRPGPLPNEMVLHTGDLFRMDEEGYLYFFGRKDDIIKTRGEKVSPKEVEDVLYALPGIAEAAVVGIPDDILGQSIRAVVTLCEGAQLTEKDVLRHCSARLENFMVPQSVTFVPSLPKTGTGKINKRLVAASQTGEES